MASILPENEPDPLGDSSKLPWFKDRSGHHPFSLIKRCSAQSGDSTSFPFQCVSFFPWTSDSINVLWGGALGALQGWKEMISEFTGTVAVGGFGKLYVFSIRTTTSPLCVKLLPDTSRQKQKKAKHRSKDTAESRNEDATRSRTEDSENGQSKHEITPNVRCVAWVLNQHAPLEPLVVFSGFGVLYTFNVKRRRMVSYLRGHGGEITSIAVHPTHPQIFCTTSRDFSTRIYDITLPPIVKPNNPHWPPGTEPSLAGPAHGLHMTEVEGHGTGRCVAVLMGGRSGGHRAAVLGAAFHSVLPLLATCGMDRVVKIWHIPSLSGERIAREDKPLFSSSVIHKARVLSITWLSHDVLLTHSAPALMRRDPNNYEDVYFENGTMALWRWLGLDRFFPPGQPVQTVLRGCASDYQESSSFKLISTYTLPQIPTEHKHIPISPCLHVYQSPYHDPLLLFTMLKSNKIRMLNVTHLSPRKPPPFPIDEDVVEMTKKMRLVDNDDEGEDGNFFSRRSDFPTIDGWEIETEDGGQTGDTNLNSEHDTLEACAMGMDGRVIVGVGSQDTIWIWTIKESPIQ